MIMKTHSLTNNIINTYLENAYTKRISIYTYFSTNFPSSFVTNDMVVRGNKVFPKRFIQEGTNFLLKIEFRNEPSRKNLMELKILYPSVFNREYIKEYNFRWRKKIERVWWHESVKYLLSVDEILDSKSEEEEESLNKHPFLI